MPGSQQTLPGCSNSRLPSGWVLAPAHEKASDLCSSHPGRQTGAFESILVLLFPAKAVAGSSSPPVCPNRNVSPRCSQQVPQTRAGAATSAMSHTPSPAWAGTPTPSKGVQIDPRASETRKCWKKGSGSSESLGRRDVQREEQEPPPQARPGVQGSPGYSSTAPAQLWLTPARGDGSGERPPPFQAQTQPSPNHTDPG